jgi:hypothetical protein
MIKDVENVKYFVCVISHYLEKQKNSEDYNLGFRDACEVVDNFLDCIISGEYGDFDKHLDKKKAE